MNKVKRNVVWKDPRCESDCISEFMNPNDSADYKISVDISNIIADVIGNDYEDKKIVSKLLNNLIGEQIKQYLREYDNVVAEDILSTLKRWKLGKLKKWLSNVDFDHARHAKLSSFANEVAELINKYKEENQLQKVKDKILLLNFEPGTNNDTADGKVWLSNIMMIIDEELSTAKPKKQDERNETIG